MIKIIRTPEEERNTRFLTVYPTPFDAVKALLEELTPHELGMIKRDEITRIQNSKRGVKLVPFKGPDDVA